MLLPNLSRLPHISHSVINFHGLDIPAGWAVPEHLWVVLSRGDMVKEAWAELNLKATAVFEAGSKYSQLVNARADWLFRREERPLSTTMPRWNASGLCVVGDRLNLLLRTGSATGWDVEYYRARFALEIAVAELCEMLDGGTFMRLAKVLCPTGHSREALNDWYESTVGELLDIAPGWLEKSFTLRSTLMDVAEHDSEVTIFADVLDSTSSGGRRGKDIVCQRRQIYDLRYGSLTPLCKLAWVTESLANRIADIDSGSGPIM